MDQREPTPTADLRRLVAADAREGVGHPAAVDAAVVPDAEAEAEIAAQLRHGAVALLAAPQRLVHARELGGALGDRALELAARQHEMPTRPLRADAQLEAEHGRRHEHPEPEQPVLRLLAGLEPQVERAGAAQ